MMVFRLERLTHWISRRKFYPSCCKPTETRAARPTEIKAGRFKPFKTGRKTMIAREARGELATPLKTRLNL